MCSLRQKYYKQWQIKVKSREGAVTETFFMKKN